MQPKDVKISMGFPFFNPVTQLLFLKKYQNKQAKIIIENMYSDNNKILKLRLMGIPIYMGLKKAREGKGQNCFMELSQSNELNKT